MSVPRDRIRRVKRLWQKAHQHTAKKCVKVKSDSLDLSISMYSRVLLLLNALHRDMIAARIFVDSIVFLEHSPMEAASR